METIRRLIKGWVGKGLLILFCAPFVFFGVEGIFSKTISKSEAVITVNGETVSPSELVSVIENMKAARQSQLPEGLNISDFITDITFKQIAIKQLTDQMVLQSFAQDMGIEVSDLQAMMQLSEQFPQLKDEYGRFDLNALADLLAQAGGGYSVNAIIDDVRAELARFQLAQSFGLGGFVLPDEASRRLRLQWELRSAEVAKVPAGAFIKGVKVEESEIRDWYERHQHEFKIPEKVLPSYVKVDMRQYIDEEAVSDEQIQLAYEREVEAKRTSEERRSRHILIETNDTRNLEDAKKRASLVLAELDGGADFEAMVAKYSDDLASKIDGGDLGFAERSVFQGAFADILFGMNEVGERSGLVETPEGIHIIELTSIRLPPIASLADSEERLRSKIAEEEARGYFESIFDQLIDAAAEFDTLDEVARVSGGEIVAPQLWIERGRGNDFFKNETVQSALFSPILIEDGLNSEVIELGSHEVVVVRVREHKPVSIQPFEEVDGVIRGRLLRVKAKQAAERWALAQVARLSESGDIEWPSYFSEEENNEVPEWVLHGNLFRMTSRLEKDLVNKIYQVAKPPAGGATFDSWVKTNGEVYLLRLNDVRQFDPIPPETLITEEDKAVYDAWKHLGDKPNQTIRHDLALEWFKTIGRASLSFLKDRADITIKLDQDGGV